MEYRVIHKKWYRKK